MKIVVVGANGFLARNLAEKLEIHYEVFRFVRSHPLGKLKDSQIFETKDFSKIRSNILSIKPDLIINLASDYSVLHQYEGIKTIIDTEINLPAHLADICCELGIYLMQTKSLFQKSEKNSGINLYAASKNARDELMKYYIAFNQLKLINFLLGDVYGYADTREKLIPSVIAHVEAGDSSNFILENPERKFYPIYLEDVLHIIITAIKRIESKSMKLGDVQCFQEDGMTLKNFVDEVQAIVSKDRFNVSWLLKSTEFRETELVVPSDLISLVSKFTPFEIGFRSVLNMSNIK
jgi:CDP-3, 6-dideoxy-D-glycero-L-glycero-4-hexulose-4-reductase